MMRTACTLLLLPALALSLAAQELPSADGQPEQPPHPSGPAEDDVSPRPLPALPDTELYTDRDQAADEAPGNGTATAEVEDPIALHIEKGVQLLESLEAMMAAVGNRESADKVADKLGLMSRELQKWVQGFAALPPLDEEEGQVYCDRYLGTVRDLNDRIREQGNRLSAAQYYGSVKLAQELQRLVLTMRK